MNKNNRVNYFLILVSLSVYVFLYYFIEKSEFVLLISGIGVLAVIYFYWIYKRGIRASHIILISILFRGIFLFQVPSFSDDCYRFAWDGIITVEGQNPYEKTPTQTLDSNEISSAYDLLGLYKKLNSKDYFTVYPPMNQLLFSTAAFLGNGSVFYLILWLKIIILLFDIGLILILFKVLRFLKLKENLAQIYAFNPLVIIELTGSVHFEGVMLFFFILGIYLLLKNKILLAAVVIGLSISVKIIPLILLPFFLPLLRLKKSLKLYFGIAITIALLVSPFISQTVINNFTQSLNLYFQSFEFNASIYYVMKEISFLQLGYKSVKIGRYLPFLLFSITMLMTWLLYLKTRKETYDFKVFDFKLFASYASLLLFVFYLLASTVHPWYIINALIFSVFIANRAFQVWSILIFLSYFAYSDFVVRYAPEGDFHQYPSYYYLVGMEYGIVLLVWCVSVFVIKKKSNN